MGVKSFHYHERDDSESYDGCIYIYDSVVVEYVDKKNRWKFDDNHVEVSKPWGYHDKPCEAAASQAGWASESEIKGR